MATVLSSKTRDTIITASLRKLLVLAQGESASATQLSLADPLLNFIVKQLDAIPSLRFKEALTVKSLAWTSGTASQALAAGVQRVNEAYFTLTATGVRTPLKMISQAALGEVSGDGTTGTPAFLYVSPHGTGATTVTAHVYPPPSADGTLYYWTKDLMDVFDSGSDPADVPDHLIRWLVYELAADMAWDYGKNLEDIDRLENKAKQLLGMVLEGVESQVIRQDVGDQPNDQNTKRT